MTRRARVSQTIKIGPFRFRLSFSRGGSRLSVSAPDGLGRLGVSVPLGRRRRGGRRSR